MLAFLNQPFYKSKVFARGLTIGDGFNPFLEERRRPFWEIAGEALRKVNQDFLEDARVDALMPPLFDGDGHT